VIIGATSAVHRATFILRIDGQRQSQRFPEVLLEVVHAGDTAPKLGMECLP
jgi:hypothetical protein